MMLTLRSKQMFKVFKYLTPDQVNPPTLTCSWCNKEFVRIAKGNTPESLIHLATQEGWVHISNRGTSGPCCASCKENLIEGLSE